MSECLLCSDNIFLTILAASLWLSLIGWCFCGLAVVADDHLVPALEKLGVYFRIPSNVAAATFLAFGSAVPEIMTSIVSTIGGKVDASLPAILGSGCIAFSVIPAACVFGIQPFLMSLEDRKRLLRAKTDDDGNKVWNDSDVAKFYTKKSADILPEEAQRLRRASSAGRARRASVGAALSRTFSGSSDQTVGRTQSSGSSANAEINRMLQNRDVFDFLPLRLASKPIMRDVFTYILSLGLTIFFIEDGSMALWESSILLLVYFIYIIVLVVFKDFWGDSEHLSEDASLETTAGITDPLLGPEGRAKPTAYTESQTESFAVGKKKGGSDDAGSKDGGKSETAHPEGTLAEDNIKKTDDDDVKKTDDDIKKTDDDDVKKTDNDDIKKTDDDDDVKQTEDDDEGLQEEKDASHDIPPEMEGIGPVGEAASGSHHGDGSGNGVTKAAAAQEPAAEEDEEFEEEEQEGWVSFILFAPFNFLFEWTVPDVEDRDLEEEPWVPPLSFTVSVIWVGLLAFATLFLVTQLCHTLGIPSSVSGVTLIALGAEIPDTVSSMALAKTGEGPGAVSNALNSQIINLLVGLGLPYFLHSVINGEGMDLGKGGSTQVFIGCLLTGIVFVFVWFTLGEACCRDKIAQLTVYHGGFLIFVYTGVVIAITIWAEIME